MANTYVNIASTTLGSNQTTVTFSSIPSTYTDLVLRMSARSIENQASQDIYLNFNGTTANYSVTYLGVVGSSVQNLRNSNQAQLSIKDGTNSATSTASTFSNVEVYIPSYTVSQDKPIYSYATFENNSATVNAIYSMAGLWRNTATISSIAIKPDWNQFATGSTFYLYGIKKN